MFKKLKNIYNIIYLRILFYLHGIKKSKNFPIEIKEEEKEIIELSSKYTMTDAITMWALIQSIKNVIQNKIDGIVATNTSLDRSILSESNLNQGGISGSLVEKKSTEIIRYISKKTNGTLPIIGVGGVSSYDTTMKKISAGATIVQVYTGWIYEGPSLIRRINKIMIDELLKD